MRKENSRETIAGTKHQVLKQHNIYRKLGQRFWDLELRNINFRQTMKLKT